ncbi:peroxisome assembly protein (Peroxin-2) [Marasmius tenuissimus]|uniref:RING-type E3 ubiquitin transferase (cysteine targeting) n=1 Tax=Marasmius tenuissimus TaxID=585030 RepID=A0ABR3A1T9_9AGAR
MSSTTSSSSWKNVWSNVQPSLSNVKDYLRAVYAPNPRVIRVGQLDSELLDQELVQLLQDPLTKSLATVNAVWARRLEPELTMLIQLALYKFSIWNSGASYGAKLQGLRYIAPSRSRQPLTPSGISRRILVLHGTLTILIPYLYARIRSYGLSHAWPDAPSSDRRRKAWSLLGGLESMHAAAGLLSFAAFLWNGHYRTIVDRLLGMRLVPSRRQIQKDISYEFMNRQMVWHAFTEFLIFLLPLISARQVQRRINRVTTSVSSFFSPAKSIHSSNQEKRGRYWALPEDQCAICAERASFNLNPADPTNIFTNMTQSIIPPASQADSEAEAPPYPINTPYITSCGHVYCYTCVAEKMMRIADEGESEEGWECLRCAQPVTEANRFVPEVVGSEWSGTGSEYEFSSDLDITDASLSGSMGSYSESGFSDDY